MLARAGSKLGLASMASFRETGAGLAGWFSWAMAALADLDLFFQDQMSRVGSLPAGELPVGAFVDAGSARKRLARVDGDAFLVVDEQRRRRGIRVAVELVVARRAANLPGHEAVTNANHLLCPS